MSNSRLSPTDLTDLILSRFAHQAQEMQVLSTEKYNGYGVRFSTDGNKTIVLQPTSDFYEISLAHGNQASMPLVKTIGWINELLKEENVFIVIPLIQCRGNRKHWILLTAYSANGRKYCHSYDPKTFNGFYLDYVTPNFELAGFITSHHNIGVQPFFDREHCGHFVTWMAKWVGESLGKVYWPISEDMPSADELVKHHEANLAAFKTSPHYQKILKERQLKINDVIEIEDDEDLAHVVFQSEKNQPPLEEKNSPNVEPVQDVFISAAEKAFEKKDRERHVLISPGSSKVKAAIEILTAFIGGMIMSGGAFTVGILLIVAPIAILFAASPPVIYTFTAIVALASLVIGVGSMCVFLKDFYFKKTKIGKRSENSMMAKADFPEPAPAISHIPTLLAQNDRAVVAAPTPSAIEPLQPVEPNKVIPAKEASVLPISVFGASTMLPDNVLELTGDLHKAKFP